MGGLLLPSADDALPKFPLFDQFSQFRDTPLIVHAASRDYQRATLEMVGVSLTGSLTLGRMLAGGSVILS